MQMILSRLVVYPIKSLNGVSREASRVLPSGALEWDRRFAFFDDTGKVINAKRFASMQRIRTRYDLQNNGSMRVLLTSPHDGQQQAEFLLPQMSQEISDWMTRELEVRVHLQDNTVTGFPDDLQAAGPTFISQATLAQVADWFDLDPEETQRRFRSNLVLHGGSAFDDDQLFGAFGQPRMFRLGEVMFEGVNPCQRCAVPARNSLTGEATPGFQKQFTSRRTQTLSPAVDPAQFNHFYRLAVNTRLHSSNQGQMIRLGDQLAFD